MGWVERVVPWFAVVLLALVAAYLAFPLYWAVRNLLRADEVTSALLGRVALFSAAIAGVVFIGLVAVRAVSPAQRWPRDGQVRVFATLGLLLCAICIPLLLLREGMLVPVVALIIYYVRLRRALVDILPPWAGGTYRPSAQQQGKAQQVIKRPPSSWDATSGVGPSRGGGGGQAAGRSRRKQGRKKRKTGR